MRPRRLPWPQHAHARETPGRQVVLDVHGAPWAADFEAEPQIGALLPCNAVVRQDAVGLTPIEIMDPRAVLQLVARSEIAEIAAEVRARPSQRAPLDTPPGT